VNWLVFGLQLACMVSSQFVAAPDARAAEVLIAAPSTSPVLLAKTLKGQPIGTALSVSLSGFADDIATMDFVQVARTAVPSSARMPMVRSPWLDVGSRTVRARLGLWLSALRAAGASVDEFVLIPPSDASIGRFTSDAAGGFARIVTDARFAALQKQFPQLVARAPNSPSGKPGPDWAVAMRRQVTSAAVNAQTAAIRAWFPKATVRFPLDLPQAIPGSTAGKDAAGGSPPAAAAVDPIIASLNSATATKAQAALNTLPDRMLPWKGGLAYAATDWSKILGRQASPALRSCVAAMDPAGQRIISEDIRRFVRPLSINDVDSSMLDGRSASAGGNAQQFALAMADCAQAHKLLTDGVTLSVLAVQQGNQAYIDRCIAILRNVADWAPFQRPGWTAYRPDLVLPRGGDGVWLATGWGICGVVDMLSILGDRVPADLQAALRMRLRGEVSQIVSDWADARPWYVRSRAVQSNQWIIPSVGLVKACLFLKDPQLLPAYNLGVENVAASLRAMGKDGEFLEGVSYAAMTLEPVFDLLADLKANGDLRCHSMGFVNNSWRWFTQMLMPGANFVNCNDSGMASVPDWARETPLPAIVAATLATSDPDAVVCMRGLFPRGNTSIHGIKYQAALDAVVARPGVALPKFAFFPAQQLLVWRSNWEMPSQPQSALGMWFKGGALGEGHCHRDQGQLSIYSGNRAILTESGTPNYSTADMDTKYASAAGHSIMQVGEVSPRGVPVDAPMSVASLGADGGIATVDSTKAYRSALSCQRTVAWSSSGRFDIADRVQFVAEIPAGTEIYRFHTGSGSPLVSEMRDGRCTLSWPDASVSISADGPIDVSQVPWPDAVSPGRVHQVVVIRSAAAMSRISVSTSVTVVPSAPLSNP
jgi:hypothetical protein